MKKILIVEDDNLIAELERDYLESENYESEICYDGNEALQKNFNEYLLILLDVMLPGINGFDLCRKIRKTSNVPIIFISAKQEDVDKFRGLGLGADDYIVKPFNPPELLARVKCHIKIHERLLNDKARMSENGQKISGIIENHGLKIDISSRQVFVEGKEVSLKNKEFDLLVFLASNPGIVFSKEDIFEKVWGMDSETDSATIMVHINRVREKIEKDPSSPEYISTIWGAGYRFLK